jgi:hypothetical protein
MKRKYILLLIMLYPIFAKSQFWDSLIIKTHPMRDFFALNPNIGFEKILSKKISVEFEFTYKNRDVEYVDEYVKTRGTSEKSNGYRIIIGVKEYFTEHKQIPKAWYSSFQIGYRNICAPNINAYGGESINILKKTYDINLLLGKGFVIFKHIFLEINLGPGISYKYWNVKNINGSNVNGDAYNPYNIKGWEPTFYINWTIGYLISKKS